MCMVRAITNKHQQREVALALRAYRLFARNKLGKVIKHRFTVKDDDAARRWVANFARSRPGLHIQRLADVSQRFVSRDVPLPLESTT